MPDKEKGKQNNIYLQNTLFEKLTMKSLKIATKGLILYHVSQNGTFMISNC